MTITSEILSPIVVLAAWTMVMWLWMYATRMPAMGKVEGLDISKATGGKGSDLDDLLPPKVQWISHNYNHLHEAPTVFYAVAIILAITGNGDGIAAQLAWGYVAIRIAHSIAQSIWNKILVRFGLFVLSSIILILLIIQTACAVF